MAKSVIDSAEHPVILSLTFQFLTLPDFNFDSNSISIDTSEDLYI